MLKNIKYITTEVWSVSSVMIYYQDDVNYCSKHWHYCLSIYWFCNENFLRNFASILLTWVSVAHSHHNNTNKVTILHSICFMKRIHWRPSIIHMKLIYYLSCYQDHDHLVWRRISGAFKPTKLRKILILGTHFFYFCLFAFFLLFFFIYSKCIK